MDSQKKLIEMCRVKAEIMTQTYTTFQILL